MPNFITQQITGFTRQNAILLLIGVGAYCAKVPLVNRKSKNVGCEDT